MKSLIDLYARDLDKLIIELNAFNNEVNLWVTQGAISNSAGNLTLHLIGNLNHFIGAIIGRTGYVRNREREFSDKDVPRDQLISSVNETKKVVLSSLQKFDEAQLKSTYPMQVFGYDMTYEYFLIHLFSHLNYHLGQINYLRRLLDS